MHNVWAWFCTNGIVIFNKESELFEYWKSQQKCLSLPKCVVVVNTYNNSITNSVDETQMENLRFLRYFSGRNLCVTDYSLRVYNNNWCSNKVVNWIVVCVTIDMRDLLVLLLSSNSLCYQLLTIIEPKIWNYVHRFPNGNLLGFVSLAPPKYLFNLFRTLLQIFILKNDLSFNFKNAIVWLRMHNGKNWIFLIRYVYI